MQKEIDKGSIIIPEFNEDVNEEHFRIFNVSNDDFRIPFWAKAKRMKDGQIISDNFTALFFLTKYGIKSYEDFDVANLPKNPEAISLNPKVARSLLDLLLKINNINPEVDLVELVELFFDRLKKLYLPTSTYLYHTLPPILSESHSTKSTNSTLISCGTIGANILKSIFKNYTNILHKFIEYPDEDEAKIHAMWSIGTLFYPIFSAYPYLYITGFKGSGKTKLLNLLKMMSFLGISAGSVTASSLFRVLEDYAPSFFIDEGEALTSGKNKPELYYVLLNGYKKGTSVARTKETTRNGVKDFIVRYFYVYSPKALVNIRGLDDVLESRCITTILQKALSKEKANKEVIGNKTLKKTIEYLHQWASLSIILSHKDISDIYESLENETELNNRDFEIFKPLLALAKFMGDEFYDDFKRIALKKYKEKQSDEQEHTEIKVLLTIRELKLFDWQTLQDVVSKIKESNPEYDWLRTKRLGNLLRRFGIHKKRLLHGKTQYYLSKELIDKNLMRYGLVISDDDVRDNVDNPKSKKSENKQKPTEILFAYDNKVLDNTRAYIFSKLIQSDMSLEKLKEEYFSDGRFEHIKESQFEDIFKKMLNDGQILEIKPNIFRSVPK